MMKGYFVIRTFVSGVIGEKIKYWVPGEKPSKSQRSIRSSVKQQERNEANAVRRVARQIHANFGKGDSLLTPSYSEDGIKRLAKDIDQNAEDHEDTRSRVRDTICGCGSEEHSGPARRQGCRSAISP